MPIDNKVLQDYVATANSGKYNSWEEINSKFPELKEYDSKALQDYVATANSGKYKDWNELNSKFPELFGTVKKKETTESSSAGGSSAMQGQETQEPSVSSTSKGKIEGDLYSGYPGKESKKYRYDEITNSWFEYSHTDATDKGNIDKYEKQITNPGRVNALNNYFKKQAYTNADARIFTGYPGKEKNEYRIVDNTWQRRQPGEDDWTNVVNQGSVDALNKQFKQDVKVSKYRSAVVDEVEIKKKEAKQELNTRLSSIDANLISMNEEDAVVKLRQLFPEFRFTEIAIGDKIRVDAPKEVDRIEISLDNYGKDNENYANQLRAFLERYSDSNLVNSLDETFKTQQDKNRELFQTTGGMYGDVVMNDPFTRAEAEKKYKESQKQLVENYNNAFVELKSNKNVSPAQIASLPKNKLVVKAIEASNEALSQKIEKLNETYKEYQSTDDIEKKNSLAEEIKVMQEDVRSSVISSSTSNKALNEATLNNTIIKSEQGNFASGMARSFADGLLSVDRIMGLSAEEHQRLLDDIVGLSATKEYTQSENRSDFSKAMFSIANSLGVAAPAMLTGGASGYVQTGLFFNQSYHEMKDELDQVEGMDGTSKFLMSTFYGAVSGALEKFGLGVVLNKSKVGNNAVKYVMSKVLRDLPKNASKEAIELAIENTSMSFAKQAIAKSVGASLTEGTTEALQYLTGEGVKEMYDLATDKDVFKHEDLGKQVWENFYLGALAGGITNSTATIAKKMFTVKGEWANEKETARLLVDLTDPDIVKERKLSIQEAVKSGQITQEQALDQITYIDKAVNLISKLPEDLSAVQSKKALDLMIERDGLSEAIKGKDENLVASTKERINEINNQLKVLGENAVQEQTTDESVLRNEESKVGLPEVEQGNKKQEVVAEEGKQKEDVSNKIKRKDLFADGGSFSEVLGGSNESSIPTAHTEINGIEFVQFSNPTTGLVDVIMSGTSDHDFVGYYRIYENGKPTNKWSSKFENKSRNKADFKTMISGVQSMLPADHQYTEKTSISTDGLRVWGQQLDRGYETQVDSNGNIVTERVAINGDAIVNELGIDVNTGNFENISVTTNQQFETVKKALKPYLEKLGLTENNIHWEDGTVKIDLPVLSKVKTKTESSLPTFEEALAIEERSKQNIEQIKKSTGQKALDFLDSISKTIDDQLNQGINDATRVLPLKTAKLIVEGLKVAVKAGMTLEQAIKKIAKDNNVSEADVENTIYSMSQAQQAKTTQRITGQAQPKQKQTQASQAAKQISKKKKNLVTVDEMTALKDQIKVTKKVAEEIAKNIKENKANAKALFVERMKGIKAKISKTQYDYTLRKAMKTDFSNPESVEIFNAYVDKVISKAENAQKIDDAYALRKKVAKKSKSKAWHIVSTAKQFAKIDPVMVEDLDMYMALANEIYNSKKPSRGTKDGVDLAQAADLDKINKYAEKEIARQEEIKKKSFMYANKNALLVEKGILKESMTYAEMIEAVKNLDDSAALTKEQKQEHYEGIRDLVRELQDEVKSREDVPSEIKEIAKYNPRDLSNKNIVEMYEILDNYLMNGIVDKSSMFIEKLKGVDNGKLAERAGVKFKPVKIMPRISMAYMNFLSSLPLIEERLLGSTLKAERFRRVSGFSEFESNVVRSIRLHEGILKRYDAKFRKIKDFNTAENIYQRGAIAYLLRNMDTEFDKRKKNLLSSIEEMKKSRRSDLVKKAEVYEKIFEDMGLKEAKSFNELNVNKNNLEAVKFWQNEWNGLYDQLSNVASTIHNKILKRDTNYSPDFYKKTKKYETYEEQFLDGKHFQDLGSVKTDMAGVLMDANPPSSLLNKYVDLDFDTNNVEEIQSALLSINTDADVIRLKSFLNSKEFDNLFEDGDLAEMMRNRYTDYINRSTNRTSTEPKLLGITNLNVISTAMALGSVFQVVKNTLPIIASTSVNVLAGRGLAGRKIKMDLFLGADKRDFLDRIDYDISMRGQEAATGIRQKLHYEAADKNKLVKLLVRGSEEILKQTMGRTDKFVARAAWMSYYESELKNKGVDIKSIDWSTHKVDDKAASYAQSMVNRQQNPSNTNLAPTAQRSAFGEALNIIQPFSPFIMNTKFRIRADFATMTSRRGDMTREERIKARASILSSIAEIATFRAIQISIYAGTVALVNAINGDSPDDEKEEISFVDKLLNGMVSQAILDSFSPLPVLDGVTAMGVNEVFELTNRMIQTEDDIAEFIHDKELEKLREGDTEPFTASELDKLRDQYFKDHTFEVDYYRKSDKLGQELSTFGKLGIPAEKLITTIKDIVEVKAQGKWKDDYGNIKYIPIEASGMANQMVAYDLLSLSPDMATMARRTRKYINKMSLSGSQYDKYVEVKSQVGDLFTIDDIYLLKATNMKVEDIVSTIFTYSNSKDRLATYKKLKEAEIIK